MSVSRCVFMYVCMHVGVDLNCFIPECPSSREKN